MNPAAPTSEDLRMYIAIWTRVIRHFRFVSFQDAKEIFSKVSAT